jgi:PBP1b-binding outer membrane lipoprotein LpoB
MKQVLQASMILICVVALVGCNGKTETSEDIQNTEPNVSESSGLPSSTNTPAHSADLIEIVGKVTYKQIEGGVCYRC